MKRFTFIQTILLIVAVQACSLDLKPKSAWSDNSYYANENQVIAVLNGGYTRMQEALGGGAIVYGSARSDEYYCSNTSRVEMDNIVNNGITPYNSYASWAAFYRVIQQANLILLHVPEMVEEGRIARQNGNSYLGQAYCMRAFAYFWMVRIWGDCPLKLEASVGSNYAKEMTRTDEGLVRKKIHEDLETAISLLEDNGDRVHFTKTAAWAIEAQLCAWEKDWEGVISANSHILENQDYGLAEFYNQRYTPTMTIDSDFYRYIAGSELVRLFNEGRGKESIFELAYSIDDNSNSNTLYGLVGGNGESLRPNLKNLFSTRRLEGDWRFFLNFYGNNPRWTKYFIGFTTFNTRDVVLLRLADFILLEAEAYIELIPQASAADKGTYLEKAVELVNQIRWRAGGDALLLSASSFDVDDLESLRAVIMNERLMELYGEGYRYFDLIRTGKLIEVMQPVNGQYNWASSVWPVYYTEVLYGAGIEQNQYYR